jgi:alpha-tubulin suppressor-like RCC1 family protein
MKSMRKLACNATNSAVIDERGEVYVWGSGKYGLLGDPKERGICPSPTKLVLQPEHA